MSSINLNKKIGGKQPEAYTNTAYIAHVECYIRQVQAESRAR